MIVEYNKDLNTFACDVHMFGRKYSILIDTYHTLEELQSNYFLKEKLITDQIIQQIRIESYIEQLNL